MLKPTLSSDGLPGRRRDVIGLGLLATLTAIKPLDAQDLESAAGDWNEFRVRFLTQDGRILDTGNHNSSHSEGQGCGLLAAVQADDEANFARMLGWTVATLGRRGDSLFAWRFQPDKRPTVDDSNNATDGDLLIAWALLKAGRRWNKSAYRRRGLAIARDLLRYCALQAGGRWLLLPAVYGFRSQQRTVVNPSYYIFPALRDLASETGDATWTRIAEDGLAMIRDARFGRWSLPADWLELPDGASRFRLAVGWPARFSFDAIRVPLNLSWAGMAPESITIACAGFWADPDHRGLPAWTDLRSNQLSPYTANSGIVAVARLTTAAILGRGDPLIMPRVATAPDYYAAALVMLSRMAWRDLGLRRDGRGLPEPRLSPTSVRSPAPYNPPPG